MLTKPLTIILIFITFNLHAQNIHEKLSKIRTIEDAKNFIEENHDSNTELITTIPEIYNSEHVSQLLELNPEDLFYEYGYTCKIISKSQLTAYRASYIYLDGNSLSLKKIAKIRNKIFKEYYKTTDFLSLFNKYNMDKNPNNGDLGWFVSEMMVTEFGKALKVHYLNELFKVDVPTNKWYYVVLKTHDDKVVTQFIILKVK